MYFLLILIIPLVLGLYAQTRVTSAYQKNLRIQSRSGITGAQAAARLMSAAGIDDVEIVEIGGELTDHYDPINRRLALSQKNYRGTSLASLGIAAHEAGHAIQDKVGYAPLKTRMAIIPITNLAAKILPFVMISSIFIAGSSSMSLLLLDICIGIYLILTIFQLVTLPVEFNASTRAKAELHKLDIVGRDELAAVDETLDAAAFTYVAAFVTSLLYLLYFVMQRQSR